jgi:hypothetical protein
LRGEVYDVVAVPDHDQLTLYVDRLRDNAPVSAATVQLTKGDQTIAVRPTGPGTWIGDAPWVETPGNHDLTVTITGPDGDDLLAGQLAIAGEAEDDHDNHTPWLLLAGVGGAALLLGGALGYGLRRRVGAALGALLVLGLAATPVDQAQAGPGHDHGAEAPAVGGDQPRRLPDGAIFAPKPTQRLLSVRTTSAQATTARAAISLPGRIVADAGRSGLVTSATGGRLIAPASGLPQLGQSVRRGQVLATLAPATDAAGLAESKGALAQELALAEARVARLTRVADLVPGKDIDEARLAVANLKQRLAALRLPIEVLRAPIDGVIAAAPVPAGGQVAPGGVAFEIAGGGAVVEAHVADPGALLATQASARLGNGAVLPLSFLGKSATLEAGSLTARFRIEGAGANLVLGQPVTVLVESGPMLSGIVVPREAVVRGLNGQPQVLVHSAPERFTPTAVRFVPLDAARALVRQGVAADSRVVVQGAALLNQIR